MQQLDLLSRQRQRCLPSQEQDDKHDDHNDNYGSNADTHG
jgi:hypothetical protein